MKLTKSQFSNWEDETDKGYERIFDDELCISIDTKKYSSKQVADYILMCQEKAGEYDKMERMVFDLTKRLKICEENAKNGMN
jgi:spermidine/putrescine-binding protein